VTDTTTDTPTSPNDAPAPVETPAAVAAPEAKADAPADPDATLLGAEEAPKAEGEAVSEAPAGAPEKYELKLEGVELDPGLIGEAEPILRELGLSNDQANALLPLAPKIIAKAQDATLQQMIDAGAQQRKQWLDAFNADPDIGGAKREETTHLAAKGLDALGFAADHPFRKALNESGFGNHPDMIRTFRRLGEMVGEDGSFHRSNDGVRDTTPIEKRLYPND